MFNYCYFGGVWRQEQALFWFYECVQAKTERSNKLLAEMKVHGVKVCL